MASENYNSDFSGYIVDPKKFLTPEMGDYYIGAIDDTYLKKINSIIENKDSSKTNKKDAQKAAYYTEKPPFLNDGLGSFNNVNFIKTNINITDEDIELGLISPTTLLINSTKIISDNNEKVIASLKENLEISDNNVKDYTFFVKLIGIKNMNKSKWYVDTSINLETIPIENNRYSDILNNNNYISSFEHNNDDIVQYIKIGNKWHEIKNTSNGVHVCIDSGDNNYNAVIENINILKDLINKANNEVYFVIDNYPSSKISIETDSSYMLGNSTLENEFKNKENINNIKSGYFRCFIEPKRFLNASAYIKIDNKWINLAKAMLSNPKNNALYDTTYNGVNKDIFKPDFYDPNYSKYADDFYEDAKLLDDRRDIQKQIFGMDFDSLNDWTVTIGDVTLFVPPSNITVISTIDNTSVPLLRAKGSMSKTGLHSNKVLNFSIYFNEDRGINGYEHKTKLPNGNEITYKMNGLRALISQFKFCPFLPINNKYINQTLDIDAVVVTGLSISNLEGYPKTIKVNFTCKEFDYLTYIPDIINQFDDPDKYINYFALSFNWPTMRYYYQRPILAGDDLASKKYEFNSDNFNAEIMKNRTLLSPMSFMDPTIKFFLADKTYLDELYDMYLDANRIAQTGVKFDQDDKDNLTQLSFVFEAIKSVSESEDFIKTLNELNTIEFKKITSTTTGDRYSEQNLNIVPEIRPAKEKINNILDMLNKKVTSINETIGHNLINKTYYSYDKVSISDTEFKIYCSLNIVLNTPVNDKDAFDNLGFACSNFLNTQQNRTLQKNTIVVPITAILIKDDKDNSFYSSSYCIKKGTFSLDWEDADMTVLLFSTKAKEQETMVKSYNLSFKNTENIPFNEYDVGTVRIKSYSAILDNHVSQIYLKDIDGTAPQYLGGEDMIFSIVVETTDEKTVQTLSNLPKIVSSFTRKYKSIMPCYPLRIDSEITRFLGTFEMIVEDVQAIATANNNPVRTLVLNLRAVDRTYRSREALRRIEQDNSGKIYSSERHEKQVQSYFDIKKVISKAELYPDLELPTIKEMEDIGYQFIRYKFQDYREYVDPDFYYIYPNKLASSIIREACINCGDACSKSTCTLTDSSNGVVSISPDKKMGYKVVNENNEIIKQKETSNQINKAIDKSIADKKQKEKEDNLAQKAKLKPNLENKETYEAWTICNDIKTIFFESNKKIQYDAFIQTTKSRNQNPDDVINNTDNNTDNNENTKENADKDTDNASVNNTDAKESNTTKKSTSVSKKYVEGKELYIKLEEARKASNEIEYYLNNTYINEEVYDKLYTPNIVTVEGSLYENEFYEAIKTLIYNTIDKFFSDSEPISNMLSPLNIEINDNFKSVVKDIIYSFACAKTGTQCYSGKMASNDWRPNHFNVVGYKINRDSQDITGKDAIKTVDEGVKESIEFSIFGIKQYDKNEFAKITEQSVINPWDNIGSTNTTHYLLDPYYTYNTVETIETYKKGCITNPCYATVAFLRLCLYWLKRLIDIQALPSYNYSIMRNSLNVEENAQKDFKKVIAQSQMSTNYDLYQMSISQTHINFIKKKLYAFDAGMFWIAALLAATNGSPTILNKIQYRDYSSLNDYLKSSCVTETNFDTSDITRLVLRKSAFALVGLGRITDFDAIGIKQSSPAINYKRNLLNKIYLECADDPSIYIPHACHDMIVHDARGRMLRAFPTFYMLLVDEGRTIGQWKLHDNFYNNMCIMDMQIVKSRKIPADTATITMSNFFKTFVEDNSDNINVQEASFDNVFDAIFSPLRTTESVYKKLEDKRKKSSVNSATRLQPGIRIHIRIGYGSNADMLPVVFNGVIAEVDVQDAVNIVAQGDGIELMNPILDDREAHTVKAQDDFSLGTITNGDTPKNIMNSILTNHGGWLQDTFKDGIGEDGWLAGLIDANPYGIVHFGDKDYKDIIPSGEPTQNIYEAVSKPAWGTDDSITMTYADDDAPTITFELLGKTVWDVANICRSVSPDFICGIAPFDFRSTLFIGHPRYYYAYSYYKDGQAILEKRKPYQQYHIYTSSTDIIDNKIKASSRDIKTAALGLYQVAESFNIKSQQRVGPIFADADIFPEFQKTMIVDTQLYGKGLPFFGTITNTLTNSLLDNFSSSPHEKIAWRMTASALKENMKDMYSGDLIVLGDPTVKPHDRIYLSDNYVNMQGQCLVKEVVHHFSVTEGFITTISPDLIGVVDDPFEVTNQQMFSTVGAITSTALSLASYSFFNKKIGKALSTKDLSKIIPKPVADIIEKSKGKIENIKDTTANGKKAKKILSLANKTKNFIKLGGTASGIFAAIGSSALLLPTLAIGAQAICFYMVGNYISNTLYRTLRNLQAMQIFPLKKNLIPFTAGVSGSQGFVYGSPTYNQQGALTSFMSNLLGDNQDDCWLISCLKDYFIDDNIKDVANKNMHNLNIINSDNKPVRDTKQFENSMKNIAFSQSTIPKDYRELQIIKLATSNKDMVVAYKKYALLSDDFYNDTKLSNNILLSDSEQLQPYISEKFLIILHETPALNQNLNVTVNAININGITKYIKAIKYKTKDNKTIYDIPFLNPNALSVLIEILRREKNQMPPVNSSDQYENYNYTKNSFILLKSALRANDSDTLASTGFSFILEPYGNIVEFFEDVITNFKTDIENEAKNNSTLNNTIFDFKKLDKGNEYAFTVYMPSASSQNTEENT